ncbi:MAG: prepilin peptidase [Candidatus Marinimicrobia bacterium]|nr:prepilin peptidase [Candidatus Neomarinimicrobiota bacterium]
MSIIFFISGLFIGSFLNVLIYRLPRNESIVSPRSHCPHCNKKIHFYDNIPVISYIILQGKCRYCKSKISPRYLIVEIITAVILVSLYHIFGITLEMLFFSIFALILIVISFIDIENMKILNKIVFPGIAIGLFMTLIFRPNNIVQSLIGMVCGGGVLLLWFYIGRLLFKKDGLGAGDIKFAALIGVFLGVKNTLIALFLSPLFFTLIAIFLIPLKKVKLNSKIPFAPFLSAGAFVSLCFGDELLSWYLNNFIV